MRRRPTLGLLVESLADAYQESIFCGVLELAREADANLICFAGGQVAGETPHRAARNDAFALVGPECVDALVILAAPMSFLVGADGIRRYCERFGKLPTVSIGVPLNDTPSIGVDDTAGIHEAIDHLVEVHGRRSIAFIRGPLSNSEAELRYRAYLDALEGHGIAPSEEWVATGDFNPSTGEDAVRLILDERGAKVDAILAANDSMALGAVKALQARRIRVPEDIAVVGFDDLEQARFNSPPLTTVRQPIRLLGRIAADLTLARLNGKRVPERTLLPTRLIARRSCGCRSRVEPIGRISRVPEPNETVEAMLASRHARIAGDLLAAFGPAASDRDRVAAERLLEGLNRELRGGADRDGLLAAVEEALRTRLDSGGDIGALHDVLATLRKHSIPWLEEGTRRERLETLFQHAHALVGKYAESAQAEHRLRAEALTRAIGEVSESLLTTFDAPTLIGSLSERLPRLGIPSAFLSAYEADGAAGGRSRCLFAFDSRTPARLPCQGASFASRDLAPAGAIDSSRAWAFVLEPMFFKDDSMGFALLEVGPTDGIVYEALRDQISAAIKGADLVQKVVQHDRERRRLLRYVLDVTPELHRVQPLADLLQTILIHATGMLEPSPSSSRAYVGELPPHLQAPDAFVAMMDDSKLAFRAGNGHYVDGSAVTPEILAKARSILSVGSVAVIPTATVLPLSAGELQLGVIWIDRPAAETEVELLAAFANQASAAIRSMQLYEMAALDPLTGVHARRFFDDWLEREVRAAFRSHEPLTLLMVDMDQMKRINDTGGHLAGDEALAAVGRALRKNTRANDVVGRYGGDEFSVVLPQTTIETGEAIGQRLVSSVQDRTVATPSGKLPVRISVGLGTLFWQGLPEEGADEAKAGGAYFRSMAQLLIGTADEALYRAKRAGGMTTERGATISWRPW
jgi:diguanylate cyclase (GGDEF)-like protein